MTPRLTRLRIAGFKSFAEPVTLDILPGLTGVVGPNGCGKSNVVEALRWAMGETSARSLRGGEMDDVIFAGTTARASRNLAEVTITLEAAADAPLPAPFEAEAELQVTRRIERGAGSGFRANGRELRARDVQTLYADLASGARSSGMVSQGRVASLVGAKPEERRQVLEEAAGITGLHARRHEAELKLRAAEQNLSRAEDLRTQLDATREGLRRQARQAARYRGISGHVAAAEAEHLGVLHGREVAALEAAEAAFAAARAAVAAAETESACAGEILAGAEAALPGPRGEEAASRSRLERRRVEAETLAAEAARAERACADAEERARDIAADLADAGKGRDDALAGLQRLSAEAARLALRLEALPDETHQASERLGAASRTLFEAEAGSDAASSRASEAAAEQKQAAVALEQAASREAACRTRLEAAQSELGSLEAARIPQSAVDEAQAGVADASRHLADARAALVATEVARAATTHAHEQALRSRDRLRAEIDEAVQRQDTAQAQAGRARKTLAELEAGWQQARAALIPPASLAEAEARLREADAACVSHDAALEEAEFFARAAREAADAASREVADAEAASRRATEAAKAADADLRRHESEAASLARDLEQAEAGCADAALLPDARQAHEAASEALDGTESALARLAEGRVCAEAALAECRVQAAARDAELARLKAEADGLVAALGADQDGAHASVLDAVRVPPGLEAALGAAFAETADASLDPASLVFWRELGTAPAPATPSGTTPLAAGLETPSALGRALSLVVLLDDGTEGDAIQARLAPGQVAVDREGSVWRWDGYVRRPGAPNRVAARLRQRARLDEIESAQAQAEAVAHTARQALQDAQNASQAAAAFEEEARLSRAQTEARARQARDALDALAAGIARAEASRDLLLPALQRVRQDIEDATARLDAAHLEEAQARRSSPGATDAAIQADNAASGCAEMRLARQAGREAQARAATHWQRLSAEAAEAAIREAALAPQCDRARAETRDAGLACAEAGRLLATLRDRDPGEQELQAAATAERAARDAEADAVAARAQAEQALDDARLSAARLEASRTQAESRLSALLTLLEHSAQEYDAAGQDFGAAQARAGAAENAASFAEAAAAARALLGEARQAHAQAESRQRALEAEAGQARAARAATAGEIEDRQARAAEAARRCDTLGQRQAAAADERAHLTRALDDLRERALSSDSALQDAEAVHALHAQALAEAEAALRLASAGERGSQTLLAVAREALARAEGARDAAQTSLRALLARAAEKLGPDAALPAASDISPAAEERARKRLERLNRERDEMGPVNLRAETEVAELDQRIAGIEQECSELTTAIARLRGAIGHLNREGRTRLAAVFSDVDRHFQALFTRMMGGGRAHLAWSGSDDPLLAGLEIYAEPPGKKLAALSLLSGGEQALTALSLIFAVFRCTPSPVCVLDEVDAPLDDANVDRFCALLDDMVRETGTRFLVVTHHQLTMARMDRLFGVTMQERGVSRLLSVDLRRAAELVEQPVAALRAAE